MERLSLSRKQMLDAGRENFVTEDLLQRLASAFSTWRLWAEGCPVSPQRVVDAVNALEGSEPAGIRTQDTRIKSLRKLVQARPPLSI